MYVGITGPEYFARLDLILLFLSIAKFQDDVWGVGLVRGCDGGILDNSPLRYEFPG